LAVSAGVSFGAPTTSELELARKVCSLMPSIERVRFVNSGTEATMSALRAARAYSRRNRFVRFEGCYHGHADAFLTRAGSGMATFDLPASTGVPSEIGALALTLGFNDLDAVEKVFSRQGDEVAAVIVEPVAGNMGVVPPEPGFLRLLRELCDRHAALLIFDEVITGFRVAPGGAQELYGIKPDLTCLGKIIGGGFPVGAYGGRREIMEMVSPMGPVYQAGTLSGNPVSMTAGLATLSQLNAGAYRRLETVAASLESALLDESSACGVPVTVNRVGSMLGLFFGKKQVRSYADARSSGHAAYPKFHRSMLERGSYLPPSPFETIFVSTSHTATDIASTRGAARRAFEVLAG